MAGRGARPAMPKAAHGGARLRAYQSKAQGWSQGYQNVKYRGLNTAPDSATDDELDLGDDEEEAEELHDGDLYDRGNRLGTLPMRQVDSQVPKLDKPPAGDDVGDLLGDEFTNPGASKKGE